MQGRLRTAADAKTLSATIREHTPLVRHLVNQMQSRVPRHVSREDLHAAGMVGLFEAAQRYEDSRGTTFATFAATRIRGAVLDELRSMDWASRSVRRRARELGDVADDLTSTLHRSPTSTELAESIGWDHQEVLDLTADLSRAAMVSMTTVREDGEDGEVASSADFGPESWAVRSESNAAVLDAVAALPERLRHIVVSCFFDGRPQRELATELGVTESRISQLRSRALGLMREHLADEAARAESEPAAA